MSVDDITNIMVIKNYDTNVKNSSIPEFYLHVTVETVEDVFPHPPKIKSMIFKYIITLVCKLEIMEMNTVVPLDLIYSKISGDELSIQQSFSDTN